WDGLTRRAVASSDEGSFTLDYRVSLAEEGSHGHPIFLDPSMTPPTNLRMGFWTLHWDYEPRADEEPIHGFRVYLNDTLQWVEPPFGEHHYIEAAISMGLKLSPGMRPWNWKDRPFPLAKLEASRPGPPPDPATLVGEADGIPIYEREYVNYAAVTSPEGDQVCEAVGSGGFIQVTCNNPAPGELVVQENTWSGWRAWRDGERVELIGDEWLQVEAPAGRHLYEFRYLPWDAPLGLLLRSLHQVSKLRARRVKPGSSSPSASLQIAS
ncbi:MAG: hypothetical protein P8Z42_07940, partial [Anaerolineales bacterium]